jgi:hypothetical protein
MNDMEETTNPTTPKTGWAFQSAKASWCCPIIIYCLMAVGRQSGSAVLLDLIGLALMIFGFGFGIIALFGIPKYGSKGILTPALAGIICNSLLVAIFITNFIAARARHGG